MYQEYLNNLYLRIYVNNMVQTTGWAFALLAAIVVLGTVMTVVSKSKNSKKAELVMVESMTTEVETPTLAPTQAAVGPTIDLHPMVAQLKAELAGTHMPIESVPVPKLEEPPRFQPPAIMNPPAPQTPPTPATVVIGVVPVQKKEEKPTSVKEKQPTEEEPKATDEAKAPPS